MLDQLIRERGEDYALLSRLLGRNAAHLQQPIRRGRPRKLDEEHRRTRARYFRVDFVRIAWLAVGASAGALDAAAGEFVLVARSVRALGEAGVLSMIQVSGCSMEPTPGDGDDILVDRSDAAERVRDGS